MKRLVSILLAAVMLAAVFPYSALAVSETVKLTVSGTTVKKLNKELFLELNELREDMDSPALKMDKTLVSAAYKRASMLSVMYTKSNQSLEAEKLPDCFVVAKGDSYDALDKIEKSMFDEDEELNACGIANLTVEGITYWVICFDTLDKITPYSNFSPKQTKYSYTARYFLNSLSVKPQYGEFKNKTLRAKSKAYGRLTLTSGNVLKNTQKSSPVLYTSSDPEVAEVNEYGRVEAKKPSYFKPRSRYTPKKGDFVLFHWYKNDGFLANHVGIVYKVSSRSIVTIEGNTGSYSYRKSRVSKQKYSRSSSSIVGYIDTSAELGRSKAKSLSNLAKKQLGKKGRNFYYHTKAWKKVLGGKYMAANWCAIFCAWLMEQRKVDPSAVNWSPSCTAWIKQCNSRSTARITAQIAGTDLVYSYKVAVTV